jgi:hypothetical protein
MLIPQRYTRICYSLIALVLCIVLYFNTNAQSFLWRSPPKGDISPQNTPIRPSDDCSPDVEYLRSKVLGLSNEVSWSRRYIKPVWGKSDRDVIQKLSGPLIPRTKTTMNLTTGKLGETPFCPELKLGVSKPYPTKQYTNLIFGVASTYDRIRESLPSTAHWLAGTGAHIIGVVVDKEDGKSLKALEAEYAKSGVKATFIPPSLKKPVAGRTVDQKTVNVPVEQHHFMLIRDLLGFTTPQTQWLGILDDDTFFPSLYPIGEELAKYDHTQSFWLGGLSEDFVHVKQWGLMAFGGAGVFISKPLANELDPFLEKCITDATTDTGDGILRDCMYSKTQTKLTVLSRLYQHDRLVGLF